MTEAKAALRTRLAAANRATIDRQAGLAVDPRPAAPDNGAERGVLTISISR